MEKDEKKIEELTKAWEICQKYGLTKCCHNIYMEIVTEESR